MAAAWMAQQIAMMVLGKTSAVGTITTEAAKAGAGGVASMAAAPWPIDMSAPAFGASMYAASLSYAAGIPGLAVGSWEVPQDMFTKIHKGEMVVPDQIAGGLRNMVEQGGSGGMTVNISAVDAAGVKRLFDTNGQHLVSSLRKQVRSFRTGGRR